MPLDRSATTRPDPTIRQLYLYALAVCAKHFGILVHAVTLMSTHEHLVITDPKRRLPDFLRDLHRLVSLGTKVIRKWEGPVWNDEKSSVVRLLTEQAMIGCLEQEREWRIAGDLEFEVDDIKFIVMPQDDHGQGP